MEIIANEVLLLKIVLLLHTQSIRLIDNEKSIIICAVGCTVVDKAIATQT